MSPEQEAAVRAAYSVIEEPFGELLTIEEVLLATESRLRNA